MVVVRQRDDGNTAVDEGSKCRVLLPAIFTYVSMKISGFVV